MKILVTGAAGFIGFHLIKKLKNQKAEIVGVDNLNKYYDIRLKNDRLSLLKNINNFKFIKCDISNYEKLEKIFRIEKFDIVINLAAQAGVRYSFINPDSYIKNNIIGFYNILELCKKYSIKRLIYASSSSVYGNRNDVPFKTTDPVNKPISLYAASKITNEILAYDYFHNHKIPMIGLRFFTVYGEHGRPDMAYYNFTKKILDGEEIEVFNFGKMKRDFTYIEDITESIKKLIQLKKYNEFRVLNIGGERPVELRKFISIIEKYTGKEAIIKYMPLQKGDVVVTHADTTELFKLTGYKPKVRLDEGLKKFIRWFKKYYNYY
ncbi:MAG: NAD-dependent epimerase/dehydratase family protein [Ignavibacteria bacterium]|nr:NAD-dependent epimerase/dehydratase family protein [Ignavibacteria bacterium]